MILPNNFYTVMIWMGNILALSMSVLLISKYQQTPIKQIKKSRSMNKSKSSKSSTKIKQRIKPNSSQIGQIHEPLNKDLPPLLNQSVKPQVKPPVKLLIKPLPPKPKIPEIPEMTVEQSIQMIKEESPHLEYGLWDETYASTFHNSALFEESKEKLQTQLTYFFKDKLTTCVIVGPSPIIENLIPTSKTLIDYLWNSGYIPLIIPIQGMTREREDLIGSVLTDVYTRNFQTTQYLEDFLQLMLEQKIVVIIDGFDNNTFNPKNIYKPNFNIYKKKGMNEYMNVQLIMTCNRAYYDKLTTDDLEVNFAAGHRALPLMLWIF